jgi:cell division control protein 45
MDTHTCDIHLIDAHRPYNLENIFGPAVNDGLGAGTRNGHLLGNGRNGNTNDQEDGRMLGRIWVWGDGDEDKLENVKKSWEALEVSCRLCVLARILKLRPTCE